MSQTDTQASALTELQFYGRPMIVDLSYRLFFLGSIWSSPFLTEQANKLETALTAALSDPTLNGVFDQYLAPGQTGPATATTAGNRAIVAMDWPAVLTRDDLHKIAQGLLTNGRLPKTGLDSYALALILPPGTILIDPRDAVQSSAKGLASIHGTFHLTDQGNAVSVYFCAAVWSDGTNGVSVPAFQANAAWLPWENTCAALYHEMAELRTNPNVDDAPDDDSAPPENRLGWTVRFKGKWLELPDMPVLWAEDLPQKVFCKGSVGGVDNVPIQVLWSKQHVAPHLPLTFTPQMHHGFRYKAV